MTIVTVTVGIVTVGKVTEDTVIVVVVTVVQVKVTVPMSVRALRGQILFYLKRLLSCQSSLG